MLHLDRASAPAHPDTNVLKKPSGEVYGRLINLSGRRRFTSQRVVLYSLLASQEREGALAIATEALTTFRDAHVALIEGDERTPGVFCEELREVYFGAQEGDKSIRAFIALALRTLQAIESRGRAAPALVDQLVESATPLLGVLNGITQIYEDLAKRQAVEARKQLANVMSDIESIAKQARIVSFNAQIVAARAGVSGREFAVVAGELSHITGRIDELVREAMRTSVA
jgi:hypothetical protein